MANYASLLATIAANITDNNTGAITGPVLKGVLDGMVGSLGTGYQFMGVAATSTNPGTPDQKVYYLAGPGTYTNFNNITVADGEIAVLKYDSAWSKVTTPMASAAEVSQLGQEVDELRDDVGDKVQDGTERHDFTISGWTERKYVRADDGRIQDVSGVSASSAVDVSGYGGKTMYFDIIAVPGNAGVYGMAFYDSDDNYISGVMPIYGHTPQEMVSTSTTIPTNAATARFSCLTGQESNFSAYVSIPTYTYINGLGKDVADLQTETETIAEDVQDVQGLKVSTTTIDLEFADANDNVLVKFKDGEIETKNFNSAKQPSADDSLFDYEIADADNDILLRLNGGNIRTKNFDSRKAMITPLFGKKIVWYGTSIPAAGYPDVCGDYLGAEVHNEAVGSSMCRMGMPYATPDNPLGDIYGIVGLAWTVVGTSLSMKQAEKNDIFLNWTTARRQANLIAQGYTAEQVANVKGWGELLTGNPPADIMSSSYDLYRKMYYGMSYDSSTDIETGFGYIPGKVEKYLTEDSFPDLWVFDHGHNDDKDNPASEIETIPTPFNDRHYFIGAVNYLINYILQYNPRARFLIIGHYDRDEIDVFHHEEVTNAQIKLAEFWNAPIYKTWEYSFVTRSRVVTTNAYWDENGEWHDSGFDGTNGYTGVHYDGVPENIRQVDGVWVHDMSLLWVHMLDGLHPLQDDYKDFLGHSMAQYMSSNIITF